MPLDSRGLGLGCCTVPMPLTWANALKSRPPGPWGRGLVNQTAHPNVVTPHLTLHLRLAAWDLRPWDPGTLAPDPQPGLPAESPLTAALKCPELSLITHPTARTLGLCDAHGLMSHSPSTCLAPLPPNTRRLAGPPPQTDPTRGDTTHSPLRGPLEYRPHPCEGACPLLTQELRAARGKHHTSPLGLALGTQRLVFMGRYLCLLNRKCDPATLSSNLCSERDRGTLVCPRGALLWGLPIAGAVGGKAGVRVGVRPH